MGFSKVHPDAICLLKSSSVYPPPPWHLRLIYFTQFQEGTYYKTRLILWAIICPLNFQNWLGQNCRGQGKSWY